MFGLDMVLIYKVFYAAMAFCAAQLAIPIFFSGKTKSATGGIGKDLEHLKGKDGFILAKNHQLSFKKSIENVEVIAPPGEGKTTCFAHPQLLSDHFPFFTSIVINDSKGELYRDTKDYQLRIGRKVFLFEPLGKLGHYNPLDFAENFNEIRRLATDILTNGALAVRLSSGSGGLSGSDATWINMSAPLLTSSLLHFKKQSKPNNTITAAIKFLINNDAETIENTLGQSDNDLVREQFNIFSMAVGEGGSGPLTSILSTLATNVTLFLDPKIITKTSYSDFTPRMLRDERVALYIKYDPENANYLSPLMSIVYSQLIEKCKQYNNDDLNNIVWILDEFQNLGKINNFAQTVNTSREARYCFMIFCQSITRLFDIYGRNETKAINAAMKTKCILPSSSDLETLRELTELNGEEEISIQQNKNTIKMKKKVFTPDEVRRISNGMVLITAHNLKPIIAKQYKYYEDKEMLLNKYM